MSSCIATKMVLSAAGATAVGGVAAIVDTTRSTVDTVAQSSQLLSAAWERNGMISILLVMIAFLTVMITIIWVSGNRQNAEATKKRDERDKDERDYRKAKLEKEQEHHDSLIETLNSQTISIVKNAERCNGVRESISQILGRVHNAP